jgi:hypothetical protein
MGGGAEHSYDGAVLHRGLLDRDPSLAGRLPDPGGPTSRLPGRGRAFAGHRRPAARPIADRAEPKIQPGSTSHGGIYGLVRNPIYCAWVVFLIPGLALLFPSWPLLLTPSVAYISFRARIWQEEAYLEERFGDAYRTYRSEVPELLPFPRPRKRPGP